MESGAQNDGETYNDPQQCYQQFSNPDLELDTHTTQAQTLDPPVLSQTQQECKRSSGIICRLRRKLTEAHGNETNSEKTYTWSFELLHYDNVNNGGEVNEPLAEDEGDNTAASEESEDNKETVPPEDYRHEINTDDSVLDRHEPKVAHNVPNNDSTKVKSAADKVNKVINNNKRNRVKGKDLSVDNPNQFLKQGYINTVNRYRCKRCDFSCRLGSDLIAHIQKKHKANVGPYKCSECGCTTKNLVQHMRVLHNNLVQLYKCDQCSYTTRVRGKLALHAKVAHKTRSKVNKLVKTDSAIESKECLWETETQVPVDTTALHDPSVEINNECGKKIVTKPQEKGILPVRKKRGSATDKHHCQQCDYTTQWKKNLLRHVTTKHDDHANVYKCEECSYTAKIKANLAQHVRVKHDVSAAVHKCTECDYMTKLRKNLLRHVRVMHDATADVYQCPKCEYVTKVKRRLQEHTSVKHVSKEGRYRCTDCPYATDVKDGFLAHVKIVHNGEPRAHKCEECDYVTKWRKNLLRHVRLLHDVNTKVFKCTKCEYSTKVEKTFAIHIEVKHRLQGKTSKSGDAESDFEIDDSLKASLKFAGDACLAVYKCTHCDYETRWKKNLPRHVSSIHKTSPKSTAR